MNNIDSSNYVGDIKDGDCFYSQHNFYLPIPITNMASALYRYFAALDKQYPEIPLMRRHRKASLAYFDFIVDIFNKLEIKINNKEAMVIGSVYRSPLSFIKINTRKGLANNYYDSFSELINYYSKYFHYEHVMQLLPFGFSNKTESKIERLAHKYDCTLGRMISVIVSFSYDIAMYAGPDCEYFIGYFINDKHVAFDMYDRIKLENKWNKAFDDVFLNPVDAEEKIKLTSAIAPRYNGLIRINNDKPRQKFINIVDIEVISTDTLEGNHKTLTLEEIKDAKTNDFFICGC